MVVELLVEGRPQEVMAPIYDWQLKPIAQFAATADFGCFTLFGALKDKADTEARRARGEEILNYHPAFENTLLGLRLMQADILILRPEACDLVKQDGRWLLGAGESAPDVGANEQRLMRVHRAEQSLPGRPFRSYVICDQGVPVTFGATNGVLVLTGDPFWHCWKTKQDSPEAFRHVQEEANRRGNERLRELPDVHTLSDAERHRRFEEFFDDEVSEAMLVQMPDYSRELSALIHREDGINPAVYSALGNTMRYAAFFRHVKAQHPRQWSEFLNSLAKVRLAPDVQTPTVSIPPAGERMRR
jgi:hypothetical protein